MVNESLSKYIRSFQVQDPSTGSDHCPLKLEVELQNNNISKVKNNTTKRPPPIRWNEKTEREFVNRMNSDELRELITSIHKLLDDNADNIDMIVDKIGEIYIGTNKKKQQKSRKTNPKHNLKKWYDHTCEDLSRRLKNTAKVLANSPNNPHFRSNLCKTRKQYKKLLKDKKKEWKNQMIRKLEEAEKQDPKEYWRLVNELREKKQNGAYFDAERFTLFFEKLYSAPENKNKEIEEYVEKMLNQIPHISNEPEFTLEELIKAIKALKCNKSAGPDRIPAEMLKTSSEPILHLLLKTMNKVKSTFQYPAKWAIGITSLLLKDGDDEDPNNYRAITVTDVLSKLLAIMINSRLEKWSSENKIIRKEQIGFEKKSRPSDHLFVFKTLIDTYKNQGKKLYVCFVDFQKAFDSVWRIGLFYKLIKYGMDIGFIKLIKNMYDKTSQSLKINNETTRCFRTYKGVKQGCILSPRLFNIFLNDLPEIFDNSCNPVNLGTDQKINCLMYADDLIILSESEEGLQECMHKLDKYTDKWGLKINIDKTKVMIIQKGGRKKLAKFYCGDNILKNTNSYKYLGTIISDTGSFKLNEINLKKKGLRASFIISKNIGPYSKPSTSIKIFEKVIEPILLYNCEVTGAFFPDTWNYDKFIKQMWNIGDEMNKVVLGFLRQLLGVNKKTCNTAIQGETGKHPICIKIFTHIIKYWIRLSTTQNPFLKLSANLNNQNLKNKKTSWERIVAYLLKLTNITETPSLDANNSTRIASKFKKEIRTCYETWWKNQAVTTGESKLDFFYKHKRSFKYESYLDNIPKYIRTYITRLRMSCHSLPVEILRYRSKGTKIMRDQRKCTICNTNETGNEEHYLLTCSNSEISHARENFLLSIRKEFTQFNSFTNKNIVDYCMNMNDTNIQLQMAKYVKSILTIYKEETGGKIEIPKPDAITRAGRQTKKPNKLNL